MALSLTSRERDGGHGGDCVWQAQCCERRKQAESRVDDSTCSMSVRTPLDVVRLRARGVALSSLASLALAPVPLVSWTLR